MEYDLDYEIRFNTECEFKNSYPYPWSIQEFSSDGKKFGQDQIPWNWSLIFSASELRYSRSIGIDKYNEDPKSIQDNEVITYLT